MSTTQKCERAAFLCAAGLGNDSLPFWEIPEGDIEAIVNSNVVHNKMYVASNAFLDHASVRLAQCSVAK